MNAHALADVGGGWLMPQDCFDARSLARRLEALLAYPSSLATAAAAAKQLGEPYAARRVADVVGGMVSANGNDATGGRDRDAAVVREAAE